VPGEIGIQHPKKIDGRRIMHVEEINGEVFEFNYIRKMEHLHDFSNSYGNLFSKKMVCVQDTGDGRIKDGHLDIWLIGDPYMAKRELKIYYEAKWGRKLKRLPARMILNVDEPWSL
jgi:hypothetical protein